MKSFFQFILLITFFNFSTGCLSDKFNDLEGVVVQPEVALPIGTLTFDLQTLFSKDSLIQVDPDGFIKVLFRQDSITSLDVRQILGDYARDWRFLLRDSMEIGPIGLEDLMEQGNISLGQIVENLQNQNLKQFFLDNDGQSAPIQRINEPTAAKTALSPFDNFTYVDVASGQVHISVTNRFNFDLENLEFIIFDETAGANIGIIEIDRLAAGATSTGTLDLGGKRINNSISVEFPSLVSPGSSQPVFIDLESELEVEVTIMDIKIQSGRIKPTAYQFDVQSQFIPLLVNQDEKIFEALLQSATLDYTLQSDLSLPVDFEVSFPQVIQNGQPLEISGRLSSSTSRTVNLGNSTVDLTQNPQQPYNSLEISGTFSTEGRNGFINFDAAQKITYEVGISNLDITQLVGIMGTRQEDLGENEYDFGLDFSFLDSSSKELILEDPKVNLFYTNSFGVPLKAKIEASASGIFGGRKTLSSQPISVNYPSIQQIGQSVNGSFTLDKGNSNIDEVLSIYPKTIQYGGMVTFNPDDPNTVNHLTNQSRFEIGLEVELPFRFRFQNLAISDTLTKEPIGKNPDEVLEAFLIFDFKNELPFGTTIDLIGLEDGTESIILSGIEIQPAPVDNQGKVSGPSIERLEKTLSRAQIFSLFGSDQLMARASFRTVNNGRQFVSIFQQNKLEVAIGLRTLLSIQ